MVNLGMVKPPVNTLCQGGKTMNHPPMVDRSDLLRLHRRRNRGSFVHSQHRGRGKWPGETLISPWWSDGYTILLLKKIWRPSCFIEHIQAEQVLKPALYVFVCIYPTSCGWEALRLSSLIGVSSHRVELSDGIWIELATTCLATKGSASKHIKYTK